MISLICGISQNIRKQTHRDQASVYQKIKGLGVGKMGGGGQVYGDGLLVMFTLQYIQMSNYNFSYICMNIMMSDTDHVISHLSDEHYGQ